MKNLMKIKHAYSLELFCFIFFLCGVLFFGCSQPLRTLMDIGAEQKAQQNFIKRQDARFDLLLQDIQDGRLKKGENLEAVERRYGDPILTKDLINGERSFLYRKSAQFFGAPKVYLDFDIKGILVNARIIKNEDIKRQ